MTEPLFHVIATGRPAAGFDAVDVAQRLERQLKLTAAQAARLLDGSPAIAKRGVTRAVAEQYCARLGAAGLEVRIEPAASSATAPAADGVATPDAVLAARTQSTDFFRDAATPLAQLRSARHAARIATTGMRTAGIVLGYAALVLLAALALIAYTVFFSYLLSAPPLLFSIPVFLVPCLALLVVNALLWRPLLPLARPPEPGFALDPRQQPQLFHWLARLCELVAAPMPRTVALGAQPAHEVHMTNERDAWRRADYRLVLSLPLLDVAALRDNSALVAATLATRAAPASLRTLAALHIARARIAACRDGADRLAARCARSIETGRLAAPVPALFALHNRLLEPFAKQLDLQHRRLARHLQLESDRLHAALAGAERFADNLLLQHKLEQAARDADALNRAGSADGLAADLPALVRYYFDHFDAAVETKLRQQWREVTRHSLRDELPEPAERIEAAQSASAGGALGADADVALLDYRDELARSVTEADYRQAGIAFDPARLRPVDALAFAAAEDLLQREQMARYFNRWFVPFRFWRPADFVLIRAMPVADAVQQLNVCVNEIRRLSPDRSRLLSEYERLHNQLHELLLGQQVLAQGQPFQFRYLTHDGTTLQPLVEERQQQVAKLMEQLATQETIMGGRISLALRLCGQSQRDAEKLHQALVALSALDSRLYKLALDVQQFEQLVQRQYVQRETYYEAPIARLEERIEDACRLLHERLKDIPYPLDTRHATLEDFIATLPAATGRDPQATLQRTRQLLNALYTFNEALSRTAAGFGTIAEEAYSVEPIKLLNA